MVLVGVQAVGVGSEAIAGMCRSIAAWAAEQGKPKQMPQVEDIQPLVQRIQVILCHSYYCKYHRTKLARTQ